MGNYQKLREDLVKIQSNYKLHCLNGRLILFGSCVRGDYNGLSDIDLCYVSEDKLSLEERLILEGLLLEGVLSDCDFLTCTEDELKCADGYSIFSKVRLEGKEFTR